MRNRHGIGVLAGLLLIASAAPAWGEPGERLAEAIKGLSLVLVGPGIVLSFVSLQVVLWLLAPAPLAATSRAIARGWGRCLVAGIIAAVVGFLLLAALGDRGPVASALGAVVVGAIALGVLAGVTAVASLLGQAAVEMATGAAGSQAVGVAVGAVLVVAASVFPIVGWVLFIYFLLVGLGGFLVAMAGGGKEL
jgi:hypothetical protein